MAEFPFARLYETYFPEPADSSLAAVGFVCWREAANESGDAVLARVAAAAESNPDSRRVLAALFGNSPHLTQLARTDPAVMCRILADGAEPVVAEALADLSAARGANDDETALMRRLRTAKRRIGLAVAVADIAGAWSLAKVTGALSDLADAALGATAAHLLRTAAQAGAFCLTDPTRPEDGSGLVVLAMGKLGSRELNYSSDIDLIILYDRDRIQTEDPDGLQRRFVRLTRDLVRLIETLTADGYVFRTDLRLRPDPGATPIAMSIAAAESYYESLGQNWERAAMIKARPVAGDLEAGQQFLAHLRPFIWRKSLDFDAIQDIHSIKRQIHAHYGGGRIAVAGHDIKLGRGGIREIEFFAQTQQLIFGGREPKLRLAPTLQALDALASCGLVANEVVGDLKEAYEFLRRVEHRLQMIDDAQTQTLPADPRALQALAVFLGFADTGAFSDALLARLRTVENHYARLFEHAPSLGAEGQVQGNLVFTGVDADAATLATLSGLGFRNAESVHATIRGWHHGRYRAMRSTRARELLTELTPALLKALASAPDPDGAFVRFDAFLAGLPAGVQLFSLFHANLGLLTLVAEVMGAAPGLAEHLSRRPALLDAVVSPGFLEPPPERVALARDLDRQFAPAIYVEEVLDTSRRWAHDRRFQIGVQFLKGLLSPEATAAAYSDVAETVIAALLPRIEDEFSRVHGRLPGAGMVVLAMGKLGGREMTPTSDLDLIFIYDVPPGIEISDGSKPLPPIQYYARLSQRLINAVVCLTAEGRLYEVDMRLRPSGNKGPLAVSLDSFTFYQDREAWTWEHLALTRARPVAGPVALRARLAAAIHKVLTRPRDPDRLVADVAAMRARMAAEHGSDALWDLKHFRGGLVDVEFAAQYLQLRYGHNRPEILCQGTRATLEVAKQEALLAANDANTLIGAHALWQALQAMLRLALVDAPSATRQVEFPASLKRDLARVGGAIDFPALERKVRDTAAAAAAVFRHLIEERATALSPSLKSDMTGFPAPARQDSAT